MESPHDTPATDQTVTPQKDEHTPARPFGTEDTARSSGAPMVSGSSRIEIYCALHSAIYEWVAGGLPSEGLTSQESLRIGKFQTAEAIIRMAILAYLVKVGVRRCCLFPALSLGQATGPALTRLGLARARQKPHVDSSGLRWLLYAVEGAPISADEELNRVLGHLYHEVEPAKGNVIRWVASSASLEIPLWKEYIPGTGANLAAFTDRLEVYRKALAPLFYNVHIRIG